MGNTIKNYEKKRRKEQEAAKRKIMQELFNDTLGKMNIPNEIKVKASEVYDVIK